MQTLALLVIPLALLCIGMVSMTIAFYHLMVARKALKNLREQDPFKRLPRTLYTYTPTREASSARSRDYLN